MRTLTTTRATAPAGRVPARPDLELVGVVPLSSRRAKRSLLSLDQVLRSGPYRSPSRVFWVVDNGSAHRGQTAKEPSNREPRPLVHLKSLTNLEKLHLHTSQATDAGLCRLKGLITLRDLDLGYTGITDEGTASLKALVNLRKLDIIATKITEGGVQQLQSALPTIRIER
jgi:hypothetical protein